MNYKVGNIKCRARPRGPNYWTLQGARPIELSDLIDLIRV